MLQDATASNWMLIFTEFPMHRTIVAVMALVALSACQAQRADKPLVKDARVRLAAVPGGPAGGYFTLEGGAKDDRLVRIDSAVVNKIELHESVMNGGMMTMRPIAEVPMLFTFASGTRIEVEAKSVAAGDDMGGMRH